MLRHSVLSGSFGSSFLRKKVIIHQIHQFMPPGLGSDLIYTLYTTFGLVLKFTLGNVKSAPKYG